MPATAYVVRRIVPKDANRDDIPNPRLQYAAAFLTQTAAEEHARHLDRVHKQTVAPVEVNPFHDHRLEAVTTLPEFALLDWLMEAGVPLPDQTEFAKLSPWEQKKNGGEARRLMWVAWWETTMATGPLEPERRAKVWEAFNLYRFHEVVDVPTAGPDRKAPPTGKLFAVVHQHWEYDDCFYCGANDAVEVYRTRESAEHAARLRYAESADEREDWNGGPNEYRVIELPHESVED